MVPSTPFIAWFEENIIQHMFHDIPVAHDPRTSFERISHVAASRGIGIASPVRQRRKSRSSFRSLYFAMMGEIASRGTDSNDHPAPTVEEPRPTQSWPLVATAHRGCEAVAYHCQSRLRLSRQVAQAPSRGHQSAAAGISELASWTGSIVGEGKLFQASLRLGASSTADGAMVFRSSWVV